MAKLPKFREAKLSLFNNLLIGSPNDPESTSDLMSTDKRIVALFELNRPSGLGVKRKPHRAYGRTWLKFHSEDTILKALNSVLKESAIKTLGKKKYDISHVESKSLRRSHKLWVARLFKVGEFVNSYHSALTHEQKPVGFISIVKRKTDLVCFITQNFDTEAKHQIITKQFINALLPTKGDVISVSKQFNERDYELMVDDLRGDSENQN